MLAARYLQTLSELDSRFREAPALGLGFSKRGGDPLLDIATRERWTRIVHHCLAEDEYAMLKAVFRNSEMLPTLHQLPKMSKLRRPAYLLKKFTDALWGILKQRTPFRYMSQLVITRSVMIEGSIEVITKFALRETTIRKTIVDNLKTLTEVTVHVWIKESKKPPRIERYDLKTSKSAQVESISKVHLRKKLEIIGSPRLAKVLDFSGKGIDGFFAILCVVDIVQRLSAHEKELDRIQDHAQLLNDFPILIDIGLRRLPNPA